MVAINEIKDADGYKTKYLPAAQKTIKDHGVLLTRSGKTVPSSKRGPNQNSRAGDNKALYLAPAVRRVFLSRVGLQYGRRRLARNVDRFGANLLATANALFSRVSKAIF
jgi:hypothetical protein